MQRKSQHATDFITTFYFHNTNLSNSTSIISWNIKNILCSEIPIINSVTFISVEVTESKFLLHIYKYQTMLMQHL